MNGILAAQILAAAQKKVFGSDFVIQDHANPVPLAEVDGKGYKIPAWVYVMEGDLPSEITEADRGTEFRNIHNNSVWILRGIGEMVDTVDQLAVMTNDSGTVSLVEIGKFFDYYARYRT